MLPFLSANKAPLVGLDISTTSVKLVELSRKGGQYRLESYAVEPMPQNVVEGDDIKDLEAAGEAIKRAIKRSGTRAKFAAVAVPASAVITKVIAMPAALSADDMETQIQLEADQYIPYPLEEVNIDFEVLGPSEHKEGMVDVLLAASRTENVDNRVAAVDVAGLTTRVVDVESYVVENAVIELIAHALPEQGAGQIIAILDVGSIKTTLHVIHDLKAVYTRDESFGGRQLTEEIMNRYGLSYEDAYRAKRQGELPDDYRTEVLAPFKDLMANQVYRALQFFYSSSEFTRVDRILLAGGSAAIPGIDELVRAKTGVSEVAVANPYATMAASAKVNVPALATDGPSLLTAGGLALRSFD